MVTTEMIVDSAFKKYIHECCDKNSAANMLRNYLDMRVRFLEGVMSTLVQGVFGDRMYVTHRMLTNHGNICATYLFL